MKRARATQRWKSRRHSVPFVILGDVWFGDMGGVKEMLCVTDCVFVVFRMSKIRLC